MNLLESATNGLVSSRFLITLLALGLALAIILLIGRIRLDDLGLDPDYLGRGIGIVVMIWAAAQVIGVIPRVVANRPVALDPVFEHGSRWDLAGGLIAGLSTASLEEIVFRGFLLIQLYLLLSRGRDKSGPALTTATVIVLAVTSLVSLPTLLPYASTRAVIESQAVLLATGLFLTWLFVRTRNIFFVIGVHALLLAPTPIVAGPHRGGAWYHSMVIALLATIWALLWPRRD